MRIFTQKLKFWEWRVELITLAFNSDEGVGIEIFTIHQGGERDSLIGLIFEPLQGEEYKYRIWFSFIFITICCEW